MHTTSCMFPLYVRSMVVGSARDQGIRQRQSQSPESVAPNVRVRNPIGQSQSPVNTSTGCRETRKRRQRVRTENRESVTPRKPGGGSRNPEENRKSTTKSRSPLKAIYLSIYLPIYLSVYLSIHPSIYSCLSI